MKGSLSLLALFVAVVCAYDTTQYTDTVRGISFSYPSAWRLSDTSLNLGGQIKLHHPEEHVFVEITHKMEHIRKRDSLEQFESYYRSAPVVEEGRIDVRVKQPTLVAGHEALTLSGMGPFGPWTTVMIRREQLVLTVHANIMLQDGQAKLVADNFRPTEEGMDDTESAFHGIVSSIRFLEDAPSNLTAIHGDVYPLREAHPEMFALAIEAHRVPSDDAAAKRDVSRRNLDGNWWAPVRGRRAICCGSGYHTGSQYYAADVQGGRGDGIYCVNDGNVIISQYNYGYGFGHLVQINHGSFKSTYAHLDTIAVGIQNIWRGNHIAGMGNSGTSAVHLHYYVRTNDYGAVNLAGSNTFSYNSDWPSGWSCSCAGFNQH